LTVVALMMVMLAMSVAPAFAGWEANGCRTGSFVSSVYSDYERAKDRNGDTFICYDLKGNNQNYVVYDNRLV
jgi:hypothetical protein